MKILWITPWFGNYRVPVYDHLNQLCEGNFHLICSGKDTSELVQQKLKARLGDNVTILADDGEVKFGNHSSDFANTGLVIKRPKGLNAAICALRPDVIITDGFGGWAPVGIRYAALHRKRVVIFYERTAHVERNCPRWRAFYRKVIGRLAAGFAINGSLTRAYLQQLGFGRYPMVEGCMVSDSEGLHQAVEAMNTDERQALATQLGIGGEGLTYLFVGQLVDRKGIKQLLAAWMTHAEHFPQDKIIGVGDGVLRDELQRRYGDVPSVCLLGPIGYDQIHRYYAVADVFVMPTLEDNWSLVVPEAMACGLPVATTPYNGCYVELVKSGENGYVFDALQPARITEMLAAFHRVDLKAMGQRSREIAKDFTPELAAKKIFTLCQRVTRNNR